MGVRSCHYDEVIISVIAPQITSLTIVYSTVYSDTDERKRQRTASLVFVRGIHRGPVNSPHKDQWRGNCFHLITSSCVRPANSLGMLCALQWPHNDRHGVSNPQRLYQVPSQTVDEVESWCLQMSHDDVIKGKYFPRYWPFVWGIHRSLVDSPNKGQ